MSECNHCWHDTGNMLTSNPPQYQLICCHCGETRNVKALPSMELSDEYGDYAWKLSIEHRKRSVKMSDLEQQSPQPTMEQISQELNAWLQERGVTLQVVAVGVRTGQPCAIDDFLPPSHNATVTLVKVQK